MTFILFDAAVENELFPFESHRMRDRFGVVVDQLFTLHGVARQASVTHFTLGLIDRLHRGQVHGQISVVVRIKGLAGLVVFPELLDISLAGFTNHGAVLSGQQRVENLLFVAIELDRMRHAFQIRGNRHVHHDLFAHRFGDEATATGQHRAGSGKSH